MALYFYPPVGQIDYEKFETSLLKRFQFLVDISECSNDWYLFKQLTEDVEYISCSEYFTQGSSYDKVSHFALRLLCSTRSDLSKLFVSSEVQLFEYRTKGMSVSEFHGLIKELKRLCLNNLEYDTELNEISKFLIKQFTSLLNNNIHELEKPLLTYDENGNENANSFYDSSLIDEIIYQYTTFEYVKPFNIYIKVPFDYALQLIKSRECIIQKSFAFIDICKIDYLLKLLFHENLKFKIENTRERAINLFQTDERFMKTLEKIKEIREYKQVESRSNTPTKSRMKVDDIEKKIKKFPLCMQIAHKTLSKTNRLSHQSRVKYTLYLKEIGLSVNDSVEFWKSYYTKEPVGNSCCNHKWSKRYVYSIRHLYGLEGRCVNYDAHSCQTLKTNDSLRNDDINCPFKYKNNANLHEILKSNGLMDDAIENILNSDQQCHNYLKYLNENNDQYPHLNNNLKLSNILIKPSNYFNYLNK